MKIRTVAGLAGATAASLVGVAGLAASPAGAGGNGAVNIPAADLIEPQYIGMPIPVFGGFTYPGEPGLPFTVFPNVKVTGNCVSAAPWLFTDPTGLVFVSGTAVLYRGTGINGLPNGLNAVGTAEFFDEADATQPVFTGPAHVWFGQDMNANGQKVMAATFSFSGSATDGSTISFHENPGTTTSASGHQNGWGEQDLNCNIAS